MSKEREEHKTVFEAYEELLKRLGVRLDDCFEVKDGRLTTFTDISHHGTPCWEPSNIRELTTEEEKTIKALLSIKDDIKIISNNKEKKLIQDEIESLKRKLEQYK